MKKLILSTLFILCLSFQASAWNPMVVVSGGGSSCPSFYNATDVIFSWDGDHDSGTEYACNTAGDALEGTNSNLTIHTDYGESGSNGANIDATDKYLTWEDSGDQYIDDVGPQTIWMRVYISATPDDYTVLFESVYNADNRLELMIADDLSNFDYYNAGSSPASATHSVLAGSWIDIAYSWTTPAGAGTPTGDHSSWGGSTWEDNDNELGYAMASNLPNITLGDNLTGANGPGAGKYINVTQFAIVDGYKSAKPW